jgi:hypothetical protein
LSIVAEEPFIIVYMLEVFEEGGPRCLDGNVIVRNGENFSIVPGGASMLKPEPAIHRGEVRKALEGGEKKLVLCIIPARQLERVED